MSADLLRRAAGLMREEAEAEAALRKGDPYFIGGEASRYERHWRPVVALANADLLDASADWWDSVKLEDPHEGEQPPCLDCALHARAIALARTYLGEEAS